MHFFLFEGPTGSGSPRGEGTLIRDNAGFRFVAGVRFFSVRARAGCQLSEKIPAGHHARRVDVVASPLLPTGRR